MYNPYNWKINKKEKECVCILDELRHVCTSIDFIRAKHIMLKEELEKTESKLVELESKKIEITKEFLEHP